MKNKFYLLPRDPTSHIPVGSLIDLYDGICRQIWKDLGVETPDNHPHVVVIEGDAEPVCSIKTLEGEQRTTSTFKLRVFVGFGWLMDQNHIEHIVVKTREFIESYRRQMESGKRVPVMQCVTLCRQSEELLAMAPLNEELKALDDEAVTVLAMARLVESAKGRRS